MEPETPTRRLVELCCATVNRFADAYRYADWRAGNYRTFRANTVLKATKDYIRENSPFGEACQAIADIEQLPEDERREAKEELWAWAQRKASELNETAKEPLGKSPMHNWATYALEADGTHQQSPVGSTAEQPHLQFAFYKAPSSSLPSNLEPGPSQPSAAGPVRRKRQSRKRVAQPESLAHSRAGVARSESRMVEISAVDASTVAEDNLNFDRGLYNIHRHSSASGQGSSSVVPQPYAQGDAAGFPNSAQDHRSTGSSSCGESMFLSNFDGPDLDYDFGGQSWDAQQIFDPVESSRPASDIGSSSASYMDVFVPSSDSSSSEYHTPASAHSLELEGGQDIPQAYHAPEMTNSTAWCSSLFDAHRSGLARLPLLPQAPLADYGGESGNGHQTWNKDTALSLAGHHLSSSDSYSSSARFRPRTRAEHSQIVEAGQYPFPSSSQLPYPVREEFPEWQHNERQAGYRLQDSEVTQPGHAQPSAVDVDMRRSDLPFYAPRHYISYEHPLLSGSSTHSEFSDVDSVGFRASHISTLNSSFHPDSRGHYLGYPAIQGPYSLAQRSAAVSSSDALTSSDLTSTSGLQPVHNLIPPNTHAGHQAIPAIYPTHGALAYGQGSQIQHPAFAATISSAASSASPRNPHERMRLVFPRSQGLSPKQHPVSRQTSTTDSFPFAPHDPSDVLGQGTFGPHRPFHGIE